MRVKAVNDLVMEPWRLQRRQINHSKLLDDIRGTLQAEQHGSATVSHWRALLWFTDYNSSRIKNTKQSSALASQQVGWVRNTNMYKKKGLYSILHAMNNNTHLNDSRWVTIEMYVVYIQKITVLRTLEFHKAETQPSVLQIKDWITFDLWHRACPDTKPAVTEVCGL